MPKKSTFPHFTVSSCPNTTVISQIPSSEHPELENISENTEATVLPRETLSQAGIVITYRERSKFRGLRSRDAYCPESDHLKSRYETYTCAFA